MRAALLGALAVVLAPGAAGQARHDFAGRWTAVEPAAVAGHELRIVQDDAKLTLEQLRPDSREVYDGFGRRVGEGQGVRESTTYRLDGTPTIALRGAGDPQQVRSSARWDRNRLVLSDVYTATGLRFERTLTLDPHGRLVLTRRRPEAGHEPTAASTSVLQPARIVFERR